MAYKDTESYTETLAMIDYKRKLSWDYERALDRQNWLPEFR